MLNTAIKAARRAGDLIQRAARDLDRVSVSLKGPKDFVSDVDRAAEQAIVEIIHHSYPHHGILAEEGTAGNTAKQSEYLWVIDPLDGTTNFLHGLPHYCVSVAVRHHDVMAHGVVYDPVRNDLFAASRGRGAFLNDRRIRVSRRDQLADCLIGTGFAFRDGKLVESYAAMMKVMMEKAAGLRRPGAAALDLAYVAAGWYDGFWEMSLQPWDVAAGSLLVVEAGGLVGDLQGADHWYQSGHIIAATPKVFDEMVHTLSPMARGL